jgi:hypothetical protein
MIPLRALQGRDYKGNSAIRQGGNYPGGSLQGLVQVAMQQKRLAVADKPLVTRPITLVAITSL